MTEVERLGIENLGEDFEGFDESWTRPIEILIPVGQIHPSFTHGR